jgi:hypothetical protein
MQHTALIAGEGMADVAIVQTDGKLPFPRPEPHCGILQDIDGCCTLPMAWPRLSDFQGSRSNVHFLSDIVMGGAPGYSISRFTVLRQ